VGEESVKAMNPTAPLRRDESVNAFFSFESESEREFVPLLSSSPSRVSFTLRLSKLPFFVRKPKTFVDDRADGIEDGENDENEGGVGEAEFHGNDEEESEGVSMVAFFFFEDDDEKRESPLSFFRNRFSKGE
jgi:hypothetical protein